MVAEISSGSTMRSSKQFAMVCALRSSGQGSVQGVRTSPGATALTRTSGASAWARDRVRLIRPAHPGLRRRPY